MINHELLSDGNAPGWQELLDMPIDEIFHTAVTNLCIEHYNKLENPEFTLEVVQSSNMESTIAIRLETSPGTEGSQAMIARIVDEIYDFINEKSDRHCSARKGSGDKYSEFRIVTS